MAPINLDVISKASLPKKSQPHNLIRSHTVIYGRGPQPPGCSPVLSWGPFRTGLKKRCASVWCSSICASSGHMCPPFVEMELRARTQPLLVQNHPPSSLPHWSAKTDRLGNADLWDLCLHLVCLNLFYWINHRWLSLPNKISQNVTHFIA